MLWTRELKPQMTNTLGEEMWRQQTSVEGEPHILYVLRKARHSIETFRFHAWEEEYEEIDAFFSFTALNVALKKYDESKKTPQVRPLF